LTDADGFKLPEIGVHAKDEDARVANRAGIFGEDVSVVHAGSDGFPVGGGVNGTEGCEGQEKCNDERGKIVEA